MQTNPDIAFMDVFRALTVDGNVRLTPDGRKAVLEIYEPNLGAFLLDRGRKSPERDLWNGSEVRELKSFILDQVTRSIAAQVRSTAGAGDGPTEPLGEWPVKRAAYMVMTDEAVVEECMRILSRLRLDDEGSVRLLAGCPVCAAVHLLAEDGGESTIE